MGKNKKKKNKEIKNEKDNSIKKDTTSKSSFRDEILCPVQDLKPTFNVDDLEFIRIASTQPLELADFISKSNQGIKFKNFEQYDQFKNLMNKYNNVAIRLMAQTKARGNDLYELTIKTMLDEVDISSIERKVLENKLPKQAER